MVRITGHQEGQEVTKLEAPCFLQLIEQQACVAHQAQVDILCRAGLAEPQLEHHAVLEKNTRPEHLDQPRQEPVEDQQLPEATHVDRRPQGVVSDPLIEGLTKGHRAGVAGRHSLSPWFTMASSCWPSASRSKPWLSPCPMACRSGSGCR